MNTRLQQFIMAENLSQSQFADAIGVARASISHILAGRNKPGFDFIESMARHFPALNLEWLITGKGKMYKDTISDSPRGASAAVGTPAQSVATAAPAGITTPGTIAGPAGMAAAVGTTDAPMDINGFDDDLFSPANMASGRNEARLAAQHEYTGGGADQPVMTGNSTVMPGSDRVSDNPDPRSLSRVTSGNPASPSAATMQVIAGKRSISKIIVLYDDNSFQELK